MDKSFPCCKHWNLSSWFAVCWTSKPGSVLIFSMYLILMLSTSLPKLIIFKVLISHLWLVATAMDRTAQEPQFVIFLYVLFFLLEFGANIAKQRSYLNKCVIYFNFLLPHHVTCGILVLQPGTKPASPALEAQSLNCWTARKVHKCVVCILNIYHRNWQLLWSR